MYLKKPAMKKKKQPKPLKRGTLRRLGAAGKRKLDKMAKARAHYLALPHAGMCQLCSEPFWNGNFDLHHKLKRSLGGDESYVNLVALHRQCHALIHCAPDSVNRVRHSSASILNGNII